MQLTFDLHQGDRRRWRMATGTPALPSPLPRPANDRRSGGRFRLAGGGSSIGRGRTEQVLLASVRMAGLLLALALAAETLP